MSAASTQGRVAFVTGASRNIGRAIAVALARAGIDVAVGARTDNDDLRETVRLVEAEGVRCLAVMADLATSAACEDAVAAVAGEYARLDILVNNAALRSNVPLEQIDDETWCRVRSSILDASFYTIRSAAPLLCQSPAGSIVNIGGVAGHAGIGGRVHVSAAKAAIAGLTRAVAAELASSGVTANCISPGRIETTRDGPLPPHFLERDTPLGRGGTPEEVAALVAFLVGPDARYLTGQTLHLNGGWHMAG